MPALASRLLATSALAMVVVAVAGCSGGAVTTGWGDDAGASPATGGSGSGSSTGPAGSSSGNGSGSGGSGAVSGSSSGSSSGGNTGVSSGSGGGSSSGSSSSSGGGGRDAGGADATAGADGSARGDAATQGTGGDSGDALAAARAQCVQIINQDRASLTPPSPPLQEATTAQESCVDGQAQADFTANTAHSAFGQCKENAQDECPNWPGPPSSIMTKCLAQMWAEGPPAAGQDNHWLNMSNAKYTKVACGFYQTPSGSWWATQDFW
jgi:hypothetical protein